MLYPDEELMAGGRPPPKRPPVYTCDNCGLTSENREAIERHLYDGHAVTRPVLMLAGRECGVSPVQVSEPTQPGDWAVLHADGAWLDRKTLSPEALPEVLAGLERCNVEVRLAGNGVEATFDIHVHIADPEDLLGVDRCLLDLRRMGRLDIAGIGEFISRSMDYKTAGLYCQGTSHYLYGLLAREQAGDSGLCQDDYVDRYNVAAEHLRGFDRPVAAAICGLIAFHFNQFPAVISAQLPPETRLHVASTRFMRLLAATDLERDLAATRSVLDGVGTWPADAVNDRIIEWACIPLDGTAGEIITEMEAYAHRCEGRDAMKLRVLAAVHHLVAGAENKARRNAQEVVNIPAANELAKRILARTK